MVLILYSAVFLVLLVFLTAVILIRWYPQVEKPFTASILVHFYLSISVAVGYIWSAGFHSDGILCALIFVAGSSLLFRWITKLDGKSTFDLHLGYLVLATYPLLLIAQLFLGSYTVPNDQMQPTLKRDDRILYLPFRYDVDLLFTGYNLFHFADPTWGDLVMIANPAVQQPDIFSKWISWILLGLYYPYQNTPEPSLLPTRIMAKPGETIRVWKNRVYIQDAILPIQEQPSADASLIKAVQGYCYREENHQTLYTVLFKQKPPERESEGGTTLPVPTEGDLFRFTYDPNQSDERNRRVFHYFINQTEIHPDIYKVYYEPIIPKSIKAAIEQETYITYTFTQNYYYVLNDNRDESSETRDSRQFGFVPRTHILGTIHLCLFPLPDLEFF